MPIGRAEIIEAFDELSDALAAYQLRLGRDVELIARPDGSASLMAAAVGGGDAFEQIAEFAEMEDLWIFLCFRGEVTAA